MKKHQLTILLVDDEVYALNLMESLLKNRHGISNIYTATTRKQAMELAVTVHPDIIFQDIRMMDANGLELADEYRRLHFSGEIVFVTAYEQYAIAAIRKAAFDYLLKPVDKDELDEMLLRLKAKMAEKPKDANITRSKLKIPTRNGFRLLDYRNVVYCEADSNYSNIKLADGQLVITSINLGSVEELLPDDTFFRLSRSMIVNTTFITELNKGKLTCLLKADGIDYTFHISKPRMKELEERL